MAIKLVLLKSGEQVISDLKELVTDDKVYGFLFENPLVVHTDVGNILLTEEGVQTPDKLGVRLESWIALSGDKKMVVPKDWIVTYVNPIKELVEMYEECANANSDQVSFTEE
jgi:hypothetical protein